MVKKSVIFLAIVVLYGFTLRFSWPNYVSLTTIEDILG